MISNKLNVILPALALSCMLLGAESIADDSARKDLGAVTCRDVLLASGEERDGFVLVLHGYLLGEAKRLTYDADVLAAATDRFFEACLESPDASALSTMRDQLKK